MPERMMVFEPGDRLATMSETGVVAVWAVNESGRINDVTPGIAVVGSSPELTHARSETERTDALCDPEAVGRLTDRAEDVTCGRCVGT